jgi:DNA-binding PadR family transcriptional regulator
LRPQQRQAQTDHRRASRKHRPIIDELVEKGLIIRFEEPWGEQNRIIKYRVSEKGKEIVKAILEPYELLFPRSEDKK